MANLLPSVSDFGGSNKIFPVDTNQTLNTSLVSYWRLNGNSTDFFGSNNGTDTAITYSTGNGKVDLGAGFDGSTSFITVTDNAGLRLTTFSISCWVKTSSTGTNPAGFQKLVYKGNASTVEPISLWLTSGKPSIEVFKNGSYDYAATSASTINDGNWHHLVAVVVASSSITLYVDNVNVASNSISTIDASDTSNMRFGARTNGDSTLNGALDEIGIWSKALSTQEVADLYNSGNADSMAASPTDSPAVIEVYKISINDSESVTELVNIAKGLPTPGSTLFPVSNTNFQIDTNGTLSTSLVSYWKMEGNSKDFVGSSSGTDTAITYSTSKGKVGQGAPFNGSTSMIDIGSNTPFNFTTAVSFNAWIRPTSFPSAQFVVGGWNFNGDAGWNMQLNSTTLFWQVFVGAIKTTSVSYSDSTAPHMVTGSYDGTNVNLYVDGVLKSQTAATGSFSAPNDFMVLGVYSFTNGGRTNQNFFNGNIDEAGIWSKALSSQEIADLYNSGLGQTMVGNVNNTDSATESITVSNPLDTFNTSDSVTVTENVSIVRVSIDVINDVVTATENVSVALADTVNVNDAETVTENVKIVLVDIISVNDTDSDTDSPTVITVDIISVNDSESVTDVLPNTPKLSIPLPISVNDTESATENVNLAKVYVISVTDSETVTEKSLVGVGGIAFDATSSSGYQPSLSTYNWSHTVYPGDKNEILIVGVSIFAVGTVSTVTYNGANLLFLMATVNGIYRTEIWYLLAPATGANTVQVNLSTSLTSIANAVSYAAVDQVTPFEADTGNTGTGNPASDSVTTDTTDSLVVDFVTTSATAISPGSGQTQIANNSGALGSGATSSKGPSHNPSTVSVSWTGLSGLDSWGDTAIALSPLLSTALENIFETAAPTENVNVNIVDILSVNDTDTATENVQVVRANIINASDADTATENTKVVQVNTMSIFESVSATDILPNTPPLVVTLPASVSETESLTELVQLQLVAFATVSDTETASEFVNIEEVDQTSAVFDLASSSDVILTLNIPLPAVIFDSETVSENISTVQVLNINVIDVSSDSDVVTGMNVSVSASVSDTEAVSESVGIQTVTSFLAFDTEAVTELTVLMIVSMPSVFESVVLAEQLSVETIEQGDAVFDSLTVIEVVSVVVVLIVNVSDSEAISEQVGLTLLKSIGSFVIMSVYGDNFTLNSGLISYPILGYATSIILQLQQ